MVTVKATVSPPAGAFSALVMVKLAAVPSVTSVLSPAMETVGGCTSVMVPVAQTRSGSLAIRVIIPHTELEGLRPFAAIAVGGQGHGIDGGRLTTAQVYLNTVGPRQVIRKVRGTALARPGGGLIHHRTQGSQPLLVSCRVKVKTILPPSAPVHRAGCRAAGHRPGWWCHTVVRVRGHRIAGARRQGDRDAAIRLVIHVAQRGHRQQRRLLPRTDGHGGGGRIAGNKNNRPQRSPSTPPSSPPQAHSGHC